jgi:hypothetical protein
MLDILGQHSDVVVADIHIDTDKLATASGCRVSSVSSIGWVKLFHLLHVDLLSI